ncbi:MAG: hypothetical protein P8184_12000, partial [Calditrichia bacterium]
STAESVQPIVKIPLSGDSVHINILFEPTVELLPPSINTRTGDRNKGLKIISVAKEEKNLEVDVEGLSGRSYSIGITQASKIISVKGASLEGNQLLFDVPGENNCEFSRHAVIVTTK